MLTRRSTNDGFVAPHISSSIDFTDSDGRRLTGTLTLPHFPRAKKAPLILICPTKPAARALMDYRPEFQMLADAGFAIAQLEGYSAANGQKMTFDDADAPQQLDHLFRFIDLLTERFPVNSNRIAILGGGHGAQLALRAIQARPENFRCAIFIDPLTGPSNWADAARARPRDKRDTTRPALLFAQERSAALTHAATLRSNGLPVSLRRLGKRYDHDSMQEVRPVFTQIEVFLNEHLYDYDVSIGPEKYLD